MFQYSFAKLLERRTGDQVKLDFSAYASLNDGIRVPNLKRFTLSLKDAGKDDLESACLFSHQGNSLSFFYKVKIYLEKSLNRRYFFEKSRATLDVDAIKDKVYFDGYWQGWRYVNEVEDVIHGEFMPSKPLSEKTASFVRKIQKENAVFLGVRRGDYLAEKAHYGSFSEGYYRDAMAYIASKVDNPVFYVFSNDIEWCKNNLDLSGFEVRYREKEDQTDDFEELIAMSNFKHAIIVNSTFHWWGAYLIKNPDKIVCCPDKWFFDDAPIDIIPPTWMRIKQS